MKVKFVKGESVKVCEDSAKKELLANGWKIEGDEPEEEKKETPKKAAKARAEK